MTSSGTEAPDSNVDGQTAASLTRSQNVHDGKPGRWLRDGGVLLHIGPPKTATTALQSALSRARSQLAAQGVLYPGDGVQHFQAANAVQRRNVAGDRNQAPPVLSVWRDLIAEVDNRDDRAIVSSELFSESSEEVCAQVVRELSPGSLQVLVTLRPLEAMLPSMWQQSVKAGRGISFQKWLRRRLKGETRNHRFWHFQDHGRLVRRWAGLVGPGNLAVMPLAAQRRGLLLSDFESIAGIGSGTLAASKTNRSLTAREVEVIRMIQKRLEIQKTDPVLFNQLVKGGAYQGLVENRTPPPEEGKVVLPPWAVQRAREIEGEMVAGIASSGVVVLGDLGSLLPQPVSHSPETLRPADEAGVDVTGGIVSPTQSDVPADIVIELMVGTVRAAQRMQVREPDRRQRVREWSRGLASTLRRSTGRRRI